MHFLEWNHERIIRCVETLSEEEIWWRANENSLSIGNQLLHLTGNIRQWAVHGLGGLPDVRQRASEFAARGEYSGAELLAMLSEVVEDARLAVSDLTEAELLRERAIQSYRHDGLFILVHVIEHFSYHTGQIICQTKALRDVDLDFYGGQDLDQTAVL